MSNDIKILDCTLRDGAYINGAQFETPAIKGILKKLQDANIEIIECGWLKDAPHKLGSSYFHVPSDIEGYLVEKNTKCTYVVMIDWDRYDVSALHDYDGKTIDAIRIVFPHGKYMQGIEVGAKVRKKGYRVFFQLANTLAYSNADLIEVANAMNIFMPEAISVVDTFGAMYEEDLERILDVLNSRLDNNIKLGFHAHNNQQLAFSNAMYFIKNLKDSGREIIVDSSLCGMGRGAGNATTELMCNYLNTHFNCDYNMNSIMDAIDMYMEGFRAKYTWGYSTQYFIAGMYQCHVNNIAYLLDNHRVNTRDMRNIIASLTVEERRKYDYDLLEAKYLENQSRLVDDEVSKQYLKSCFRGRKILLLAPGKSLNEYCQNIKEYIYINNPVVIGVNAINSKYKYDYVFFVNSARYNYAKEVHNNIFKTVDKIVLSNIKTEAAEKEYIISYNSAIKRGWEHFDNAVICCLRFLDTIDTEQVVLAGFDGFKNQYNESYCDESLPSLNVHGKWDELNVEIKDIFNDVKNSTKDRMSIEFLTESYFNG